MLHKGIIFIIAVLLTYFIIGFLAANNLWISWFDLNIYYSIGTVVGGIASVCGLIGLASEKSTAKDLEDIEADYLRKIADLREELEIKERQIMTQTKDIQFLEGKKEILNLSILRASKILFLQTKLREKEKYVNELLIKENKILRIIAEIAKHKLELNKLGEEVKLDKNVEIIKELLKSEKSTGKARDTGIFEKLPSNPISAIILILSRTVKIYVDLVRITISYIKLK